VLPLALWGVCNHHATAHVDTIFVLQGFTWLLYVRGNAGAPGTPPPLRVQLKLSGLQAGRQLCQEFVSALAFHSSVPFHDNATSFQTHFEGSAAAVGAADAWCPAAGACRSIGSAPATMAACTAGWWGGWYPACSSSSSGSTGWVCCHNPMGSAPTGTPCKRRPAADCRPEPRNPS
jgi:hypothetical protein